MIDGLKELVLYHSIIRFQVVVWKSNNWKCQYFYGYYQLGFELLNWPTDFPGYICPYEDVALVWIHGISATPVIPSLLWRTSSTSELIYWWCFRMNILLFELYKTLERFSMKWREGRGDNLSSPGFWHYQRLSLDVLRDSFGRKKLTVLEGSLSCLTSVPAVLSANCTYCSHSTCYSVLILPDILYTLIWPLCVFLFYCL